MAVVCIKYLFFFENDLYKYFLTGLYENLTFPVIWKLCKVRNCEELSTLKCPSMRSKHQLLTLRAKALPLTYLDDTKSSTFQSYLLTRMQPQSAMDFFRETPNLGRHETKKNPASMTLFRSQAWTLFLSFGYASFKQFG